MIATPAMIEVEQTGGPDPLVFDVNVVERGHKTRHEVSIAAGYARQLADTVEPADLIEGVFCFLLDREPASAILASFDVSVVPTYFPEFEAKLPDYIEE